MENNKIIFSKNNALHIMVNLYIIRYLYSHLDKAECFMIKSQRKKSRNYNEIIGISRPRMDRIFHGENFTISKKERENICSMFHIQDTFFQKDGSFMQIHMLDETDWQCFFNIKYYTDIPIGFNTKEEQKNADKVINVLKKLVIKGIIENEYDTQTPIYRIYYYFKNGTTYQEESRLTKFLKALSDLNISDWDELEGNLDQMIRCGDMLEKHTKYVKSAITYKQMRME